MTPMNWITFQSLRETHINYYRLQNKLGFIYIYIVNLGRRYLQEFYGNRLLSTRTEYRVCRSVLGLISFEKWTFAGPKAIKPNYKNVKWNTERIYTPVTEYRSRRIRCNHELHQLYTELSVKRGRLRCLGHLSSSNQTNDIQQHGRHCTGGEPRPPKWLTNAERALTTVQIIYWK
jgi:hypothetical protein